MTDVDDLVRRFIIRDFHSRWNGAILGPAHHMMRCPDVRVAFHDMDEGRISEVTADPCTAITAGMRCPHRSEVVRFYWTTFASIPEVVAELIVFEAAEVSA